MRRLLTALLLAGLIIGLAAAPGLALAGGEEPAPTPAPITILSPTAGQVVGWYGEFPVSWTRIPDVIFYRVQVFRPAGLPDEPDFIEFRYVPDTTRDWIRLDPVLHVEAGLLEPAYNHSLVVTAYGPSDALIAQYGDKNPLTGRWPYYPSYLPLDQYEVVGVSAPLVFYVDP